MPKYLPAGLIQYVLNNFSEKFPPYDITQDDVSTPLERPKPDTNQFAVEVGLSR